MQLTSDGTGMAEESLLGISDSCPGKVGLVGFVAVNLKTGAVIDAKTLKALNTPESDQTARRLLDEMQSRRKQAESEIRAACQVGSSMNADGSQER